MLEHFDRARHEVVGLVGVVDVRQALADTPQAQPQPAEQHDREARPDPAALGARGARGWRRPQQFA